MTKSSVLINTIPKIIHHDSTRIRNNRTKSLTYNSNKKIFNVKTKIKEENNHVMIDSYVEWYDIKKQRMRKKRFLQVYDCEDQECEDLIW